jgi:histidinol-phosphate aminotransferase
VDRAYEPLRLSGTATPHPPGAWEVWTPNKALGLCGVRGAYAIAPDALGAAQLDACAPSWPLGAHGAAMLEGWCDDAVHQWLAGTRSILKDWKSRQLALCESLGWETRASCANFFIVRLPHGTDLAALRARGVQLRDCASFGLPGFARLSVQPPLAQHALRENVLHSRESIAS